MIDIEHVSKHYIVDRTAVPAISDINLRIEEYAMRYITDHNKKVDLRGPVFLTARSVVAEKLAG